MKVALQVARSKPEIHEIVVAATEENVAMLTLLSYRRKCRRNTCCQ